jgi:hypothetical protein
VRAIQDEAHFVRDTGWPDWEILTEKQLQELEEADKGRPAAACRHGRTDLDRPQARTAVVEAAAWGRTSEGASKLGCIANLAKRWVTVELSDFDTDPMLLNCLNGTLRFYPPVKAPTARSNRRGSNCGRTIAATADQADGLRL